MLQVGPHVRPKISGGGGNPYAPLITQWNTENLGGTGSPTRTIRLPNLTRGRQLVDWGDGIRNYEVEHEYSVGGAYTVIVDAIITDWSFGAVGRYDALKLTNVSQCESLALTFDNEGAFDGCNNMTWTATDAPHLIQSQGVTFRDCFLFNGDIDNWDISQCFSLFGTFNRCVVYNQGMSSWDTSNVVLMIATFSGATVFNQPLPWNTSNVTSMSSMFGTADAFNQPVDQFDVSNVTNLAEMFRSADNFNQPVPSWDTSSCTTMRGMFAGTSFDQDISHFDTSNVTDMTEMFDTTPSFSQDISSWNVGQVTDMTGMLSGSGLTTAQYDAWLINLDSQPLQPNIPLGANGLTYTGAGAGGAARASLVGSPAFMTITGDSPV